MKSEIQRKTRLAHWDHVNKLFVEKEGEGPSGKVKRFWSYIKEMRSSNIGVPPLKDKGILITDPKSKAQVLNNQFNEAFSEGKCYTEHDTKINALFQTHNALKYLHLTSQLVELRNYY